MATFIMLPDGVTGTNQWNDTDNSFPFTPCAASNVDNDNGGTDYCRESTNSHEVTFTMAAPSVAEAAIDSITSVQIKMSAAYTATSGGTTRILSYMEGTDISNGNSRHDIAIGGTYATYVGDVESYATGTTDWTYANLEDLEIRLDKSSNAASRKEVRVSYLYVEVTYTAAAAAGYGNDVIGVASSDIGAINGIVTANISKVNGV